MHGVIVQVNISPGGLPKTAVEEAFLGPLQLEGDAFAHPTIHGGPLQAVLLVCAEVVDELVAGGWPLFYGALGENFTTRGLDCRRFRQGQQYRVGDAVIELTKPRGPCKALNRYGAGMPDAVYDSAVKARDPRSPKWGMSGFYGRVIQPGMVRPGAPILLLSELA